MDRTSSGERAARVPGDVRREPVEQPDPADPAAVLVEQAPAVLVRSRVARIRGGHHGDRRPVAREELPDPVAPAVGGELGLQEHCDDLLLADRPQDPHQGTMTAWPGSCSA
jgi:hypothetical protein